MFKPTTATLLRSARNFSTSRVSPQTLFIPSFPRESAHNQISEILAHRPSISVHDTEILPQGGENEAALITFSTDAHSSESAKELKAAFEKTVEGCVLTRTSAAEFLEGSNESFDPYSFQIVNLPSSTTPETLTSLFLPARSQHKSRIASFELLPSSSSNFNAPKTAYVHIGSDIDKDDFRFFIEKTRLWLKKGPASEGNTIRIIPRGLSNDLISSKAADIKAAHQRKADSNAQQAKDRQAAGLSASQPKETPPRLLEAGSAFLPIRLEIERQVAGRWGERMQSWLYPVR